MMVAARQGWPRAVILAHLAPGLQYPSAVMSVKFMGLAWTAKYLSSSEKLVLLSFADYGNDDGRSIYPSEETTSRKTSLSIRMIRGVVERLQRKGLLGISRPASNQTATEYHINAAKLSEVQ